MTHLVAIILGFVEGLTEFIPVSSSGHLVIARQLLDANNAGGLAFDAVLQLATSCALLLYFWRDIWRLKQTAWMWICRKPIEQKEKTLLCAIILGTIPAVIFGLLLEKKMDTVFRNVHLIALTLVLGSVLFWYAQRKSKQYVEKKEPTLGRGIVVGFFQCLALVPGVSRSGATISGGLISGLSQEEAVRFSFLLSLPILFGAGLKKLFEVRHELLSTGFGSSLLLGSIMAFITGYIAIRFLMKYLKTHDLTVFIWYRIILAIVILSLF
ncbi:MAG: undecaprenyl-diphosphatase UppP [Patescibacteria group bacterium]